MTDSMWCPMSFTNVNVHKDNGFFMPPGKMECTPHCAWALRFDDGHFGCCVAVECSKGLNNATFGAMPLEDDAE